MAADGSIVVTFTQQTFPPSGSAALLQHGRSDASLAESIWMNVCLQALEPFYDKLDPSFLNVRKIVREVLQKEEDLNEIVQLVGKVRLQQPVARPKACGCLQMAQWRPGVLQPSTGSPLPGAWCKAP